MELPEWMKEHRQQGSGRITGKELKKWRMAKGLTRSQLAVAIDFHISTIDRAEQRSDKPISRALQRTLQSDREVKCEIVFNADLGL